MLVDPPLLMSLLAVSPCFSLQPKVLPKLWNSTSPNQFCHPANWRGLADHPAPKVPLWTPEPKPSTRPPAVVSLQNLQQEILLCSFLSQTLQKKLSIRIPLSPPSFLPFISIFSNLPHYYPYLYHQFYPTPIHLPSTIWALNLDLG